MGAHAAPAKKSDGDKTAAIKKWSSKLGIVFLAVAIIAAIFSFLPIGKGEKKESDKTTATTSENMSRQQVSASSTGSARMVTPIGPTPCPRAVTLTIPGSSSQEWSEVIKPGDCDVIFMDNPSTIKRRYRYTGGTWSEDQHENRVGFDEAQYQNTAPEPVDMRIEFRPGS